jgi:polyphosphate kinase 2 (PPK2 family)
MFESAELGHEIGKERHDREEPELRAALLEAQYELVEGKQFPLVILISGVDGAGKGETLNQINEWMDPRHIQTNALRPMAEDDGRPPMWKFWRVLPPKGKTGVFVGSWYSVPFIQRVYGETKSARFQADIDQILRFEQMLTDEGALVLKFWLHLSKKGQKKRFERLSRKKATRWRVTETDWKHLEMYDKFQEVAQHMLRETSTADAPWLVVEGTDERYRSLTVGQTILDALRRRLDEPKIPHRNRKAGTTPSIDGVSILDRLDLDRVVDKEVYNKELDELQGRLNTLTRHKKFEKLSVVAAFEGSDAAGKGGSIRRITQALDARRYTVIPVAAPTDEEKARRTCGGSGGSCRSAAGSRSSIAPGTAASWSSASRATAARPTGCARTRRSTTSRSSWPRTAPWSSSSGSRSATRSSSSASRSARPPRTSGTRSPTRIGATATSGTPIAVRCAT